MKKKIGLLLIILMCISSLFGCISSEGSDYTIPQIDLSKENNIFGEKYNSLFTQYLIDDGADYLAHPDTVLLKSGKLMTMYPEGHGRGAVITKTSDDGGITWSERLTNTPESWKKSEETPTIYRLNFNDGSEKIVMISAVPKWWLANKKLRTEANGFNASFSNDDGATWTEFENFYGKNSDPYLAPIVAMSALVKLKDKDGNWLDKWMGVFHDDKFVNYKTYLTFENGKMIWSKPIPYMSDFRRIEKYTSMCEVEIIRNEIGTGNQLCMITRSNGKAGRKNNNSMISFSNDEGETWTKPRSVPQAYSGERHKAEWLPDGRLFITFRSIERDGEKVKKYASKGKNWYSEGWIGWVGTYEDLVNGKEGQYRIKLAHTFLPDQNQIGKDANADTGYSGNAVLADGTIFTSSYGCFDKTKLDKDNNLKTIIIGKRINIHLLDELVRSRH